MELHQTRLTSVPLHPRNVGVESLAQVFSYLGVSVVQISIWRLRIPIRVSCRCRQDTQVAVFRYFTLRSLSRSMLPPC